MELSHIEILRNGSLVVRTCLKDGKNDYAALLH